MKGTTYNPNLSACILSTPYNETEGCNNSEICGKAWIVENDKHEKICQTKHKINSTLFDNMPIKVDFLNYFKNCSNECLVNYFTTNTGNSFEIINGYYEECYCIISEPARLCNDECTITYINKDLGIINHWNEINQSDESYIKYSIQRSGDDAEWCKCPSPTELKYISKAEKPECCIGDECLNSSLPKCCSESKAFIQLNHVYYGVENDEYCIWPAEKKIPELVIRPAIYKKRTTSWDLGPIHKVLPTSSKVISTYSSIPKTITSTNTISYAKSLPKYAISEAILITSTTDVNIYPVTLNEYLTTLMTIPSQKKVVKITKKVTSKVTKKITVKVTKKKDSPQ